VFISDIHMNLDAPYSWFRSHVPDLAAMLEQVNSRRDVAELVILGDLVDDWVSPLADSPQSFAGVLGTGINAPVVEALQAVCANPSVAVTYVVGNHDLLAFQPGNLAVLAETFPGMTLVAGAPGLGSYLKSEVVWAEHGHRYTLFNSPDIWSRPGSHLPLGYFISRLAASKSVSEGRTYTTPQVLDSFVNSPQDAADILARHGLSGQALGGAIDDAFIIAVFNAIALWSGSSPFSRFIMDDLDGYTVHPSVEEVAISHDTVFGDWSSRQNIVDHVQAVFNDLGSLTSAANLLFEMPQRIRSLYPFTPRLVLFGHTHEAAFQYHAGATDTIYINTGTWIDSKPSTWAEVQVEPGIGATTYEASLWFWGESQPRHTGAIVAPA
jgi:UDP-2,3-diacylglucosamine pyrophosphatase LpxH